MENVPSRDLDRRTGRFRELDGFRGIAALGVVAVHFTGNFTSVYPELGAMPFMATYGAFGVQLFFLISGYVILMTAQKATRVSDFVISRAARLYPAYWIAVSLSIFLTSIFTIPHMGVDGVSALLNYTMIQRLLLMPNVDPVYWTLAVEMQFYILIFILLVVTQAELRNSTVVKFTLIWCLTSMLLALYAYPDAHGVDPQLVALKTKVILNLGMVEWAPLFSCGMVAYMARKFDSKYFYLAAVFGIQSVAEAYLLHDGEAAVIVCVIVSVFLWVVSRDTTKILLLRPVQFYGKISYSLYIQHLIPGLLILRYLVPVVGKIPALIFAFACVTLMAWILNILGENWASFKFRKLLLVIREKIQAGAWR
ncbi:acyltransferase family protein [Dermabacteraceae bacterium P13128]